MEKYIKNFVIQKNNQKKSNKAPDRVIKTKIGEEWVEIAGGWIRKDKNQNDFVSCLMSKTWVDSKDNTKRREGYVIAAKSEISRLCAKAGEEDPFEVPPNA